MQAGNLVAASLVRRMEKPERGPGDQARAPRTSINYDNNVIVFCVIFLLVDLPFSLDINYLLLNTTVLNRNHVESV